MPSIPIYVVCLLLLSFGSIGKGWERKMTSELNPGCFEELGQECNKTYRVVYTRADGPSDTLHYFWDLSKKPSLLLALTSNSANYSFDWMRYGYNCALNFTEEPKYLFGVVLNTIWEFNDENDTGIFDLNNKSEKYVRDLHTESFSWQNTVFEHSDTRSVSLTAKADRYDDGTVKKNGSVQISLTGFGFSDHSQMLPHLLHTPNTSQVDFVINGLSTEPSFHRSRFALELVIFGSDQPSSSIQVLERKSLDDEHAPGVFTLVDVESPRSAQTAEGGYLQWRPVAYISPYRDVANSTETTIYTPHTFSHLEEMLNQTLVLSGFCNSSLSAIPLHQAAAVSFGLKEDGFYQKTKYTAWTFTVGYGKPPDEDFSLLVILVISIGLGLPALLIMISGLVMLVRRVSSKKDDLFLGR